jgi:hypothetical protein
VKVALVFAIAGLAVFPGAAGNAGGPPARAVTVQADRTAFTVPAGWFVAGARYTHLASPQERLLAASYRLPVPGDRSACGPLEAVTRIPRDGVLVFVFEYDKRSHARREDFPPRPRHFTLPRGAQQPAECVGLSRIIVFRDHGRLFQAHVALGPDAEPDVALRILDSLRVE